jgi:chaperonin GroEL (HSP60 family)
MTQTTGGTGAREAAGSVTNEATERASELKDTAAEHVGAVASEAKEQARNVMDQTRSEVTRQLDEQGRRMGQSVRQASDQLRSMAGNAEPGVVSDITRQLGDGLANVANTVEEGGVQGVAEQLRDLARRQPGLFLAGAGIAGFVVARLLRSGAMSGAGTNGGSASTTPPRTTNEWPGVIGTEPSIAPPAPAGVGAGGALGGTVTP